MAERQRDRETERQRDRETERQRDTETERYTERFASMFTFQRNIQSVGKTLTIVHVQNTTRNQNVLLVSR